MADILDPSNITSLVANAPVQIRSSTISQVQYNAFDKTLTVTFGSGGIYEYSEVSPEEYQGLLDAPSAGQYFAKSIKTHAFRRVS